MLAPWIVNEMKTASLCDKRLNARLENILDQLGSRPTGSIPSACGGYAETAAAYRFFDNDRVTFDNVFQPHIDATRRRIEEQPVVIMVQDTTELDLTRPQQQVAGTGPMDGSSRRGMFMHLLHALTPEGTPLGTARRSTGRARKTPPRARNYQGISVSRSPSNRRKATGGSQPWNTFSTWRQSYLKRSSCVWPTVKQTFTN